jgi:hypothetical protein
VAVAHPRVERLHDEIASIVQHLACAEAFFGTSTASARRLAARIAAPFAPRRLAAAVALALSLAPCASRAQWLVEGDQLRITYGPWAYHFSSSPEHVPHNHLLGFELVTTRWTFWNADRSLAGLAAFDNSFGQFSQYVWFGQEWDWRRFAGGNVFVNVTAGLLHGYKGEYQDKIPFNSAGIAPVIIPSLGIRWGRFSLQATVLGTNGFLLGGSWVFDLKPGERMALPVTRTGVAPQ